MDHTAIPRRRTLLTGALCAIVAAAALGMAGNAKAADSLTSDASLSSSTSMATELATRWKPTAWRTN